MLRFPRSILLALLAVAAYWGLTPDGAAFAMPPAGSTTVDVTGEVSITSRTGQETIALTGTATIVNAAPHSKGSVDANAAELTTLSLGGNSVTGPVTVTKSATPASIGEIRSISGDDFPATSFFDVYATVTVPAAPNPTITLHNNTPLAISTSSLSRWPPYLATYTATPNPCILLQPAIQNPAQICITSATVTITTPGVGGVTELATAVDDAERVGETTFTVGAVGTMVVLALLATFGVMANFARRRLRAGR